MAINSGELLDLAARLKARNGTRNGEYDTARQRYEGVLWDEVTNPPNPKRYSLSPNYLKPITDKSVQLLVGEMPAIQVLPPGTDEGSRRQAEKCESMLYRSWALNDAGREFKKTAWDSFVLRRGLLYVWWSKQLGEVRFKNIIPDDFYPQWDGDEMYSCVYLARRLTRALKEQYPDHADEIFADEGGEITQTFNGDAARSEWDDYTTCYYYFERDGYFAMLAGNYFSDGYLNYPFKSVPFIEFPCFPVGGNREPLNGFDHIVELNQYLAQLISQKADVISRYSNPVILDYMSGQDAEAIRRAVSAPGAVLPIRKDGDVRFLNWEGTAPDFDTQIEQIMDMIFDLAGKPRSAFGQTVTNQSGVITNLALTPSLQSNEYHQDIWGTSLSTLNEWILQLYERFGGDKDYEFRGRIPSGINNKSTKYRYNVITKGDIGGWYQNRIKWPAAIRVDDPVYIQNDLAQLTSNPPAISLYTSLENRGHEDVEAEIDRIKEQLEDPRLHPAVMEAGVNAVTALAGSGPVGESLAGGTPAAPASGDPQGALAATGSPYADDVA